MAAAPWDCDIDVVGSTVNNGTSVTNPNEINRNSNSPPFSSSAPTMPELTHKRARLSQGNNVVATAVNGYTTTVDKSTLGWPFRPDLMQLCRSKFDAKFKASLAENLSSYMTRLSSVEESFGSLQKEFKELVECMDHMKKSSDKLKKAISERGTLPVPSSGPGQRRALSSQAPRQLSQPPPVTPVVTSSAIHPLGKLPPLLGSQCSGFNVPAPSLVSMPAATYIDKTIPTRIPPTVPHAQLKTPTSKPPLSVRAMEMIDLTAEHSPIMNQLDDSLLGNKCLLPPAFRPTPPRIQGPSQFGSAPMTNAPPASKIAWFSSHNIPVTVPRNQSAPLLKPSELSFHQLQQLPVAPLPPIPIQSSQPYPVQPVPQLTIAEAAEGVCLQWTIGYPSMLFEVAVAYEIYSYASSELTAETIFTCLPWKKVGEVAALPLPMACTLTHVQSNNMYYFIVRSVDRYRRYSAWSNVVNAYVG